MERIGYSFRPTDEELVGHYLRSLMTGDKEAVLRVMQEVKFLDYDPWELQNHSKIRSEDREWYFLSSLERLEKTTTYKRRTKNGSWKVTGKPRLVEVGGGQGRITAEKRILVFQQRDEKKGTKTDGVRKTNKACWVAHEFRPKFGPPDKSNYVIYRLKKNDEPSQRRAWSAAGGRTSEAGTLSNQLYYGSKRKKNEELQSEGEPSAGKSTKETKPQNAESVELPPPLAKLPRSKGSHVASKH